MKNNVLIKGILVLIVITLLTIGFAGCGATYQIYPTTGTVYITVDTWDDYSIYMDGYYKGYTNWTGYFTIYNVPVGYHTFEASGYWYYGSSGSVYITSGVNYVTIYTW